MVAGNDLYGGTYRLFTKIFSRLGIEFTFVPTTSLGPIKDACKDNTKMIWVETPSNPLMSITDLSAVAAFAKEKNLLSVCDNTFATPYLQNPLDLGFRLVTHSTTKYLGGHSDVVGGVVITNEKELDEQIGFMQNSSGAIPGPWDCFLVLRGTKTLHVRMDRHCDNAEKVIGFLQSSSHVDKIHYPGLESHPNHEIAKAQMKRFGGMLSCTLNCDLEKAKEFITHTKLFALAESLGGVESLIEHPASMTHASLPREELIKAGFDDGLIRLSVGIENGDDLIEDLRQAMEKTFGG